MTTSCVSSAGRQGSEMSSITNSFSLIKFMIEIIPTSEPEPWLQKQQLLLGGKPSVARVLLFADERQASLPKRCGIKVYRSGPGR